MKKLNIVLESIKNLKTVGTIKFSGPKLVRKVVEPIDFTTAKNIVEFGTGDGCITRALLKKMSADAKLISFEINEKFLPLIQDLKDPRFTFIGDSAANLEKHCDDAGMEKVDVVVSSIPISLLSKEMTKEIMNAVVNRLKPNGIYVQLQYSLVSKKVYEASFQKVDFNFIPLAVPPAFVYVCSNGAAA